MTNTLDTMPESMMIGGQMMVRKYTNSSGDCFSSTDGCVLFVLENEKSFFGFIVEGFWSMTSSQALVHILKYRIFSKIYTRLPD